MMQHERRNAQRPIRGNIARLDPGQTGTAVANLYATGGTSAQVLFKIETQRLLTG